MALLITLSVITVLIAASLELNRRARVSVFSAAATRDRHTLSTMALSGINLAMAVLVKDKMESEIDSIQENWADPDKMVGWYITHRYLYFKVSIQRSLSIFSLNTGSFTMVSKGKKFESSPISSVILIALGVE